MERSVLETVSSQLAGNASTGISKVRISPLLPLHLLPFHRESSFTCQRRWSTTPRHRVRPKRSVSGFIIHPDSPAATPWIALVSCDANATTASMETCNEGRCGMRWYEFNFFFCIAKSLVIDWLASGLQIINTRYQACSLVLMACAPNQLD